MDSSNNPKYLQSFRLCFAIFKKVGMWQNGKQPIRYVVYGVVAQIFYTIWFLIGQLMYTLKTENYDEKLKNFSFLATNVAALAKYINFLVNLNKIETLYGHLVSLVDEFNEKRKFEKSMETGFLIFKLLLLSGLSGSCGLIYESIVNGELQFWLPFEIEPNSWAFKVGLVHLVMNFAFIVPLNASLNILPVLFMSSAIGLLKSFTEKLKNLRKIEDSQELEIELKKCIDLHNEIETYVNEIQNSFGKTIFFQGNVSMVSLCFYALSVAVVSF